MAYRIKRGDGSVADAIRRIAGEQIGRALAEIDAGDADFAMSVHQVRKRCKKLRGALRLVHPAFGDYGAENRAFRDTARLLSHVRDARTLTQTYDAVTGHFEGRIDRRGFAPIRGRLTRDAKRVREEPDTRERMQTFRREMAAARDRAAAWTLEADGFDAIGGGVGKTYGRARERMQEAWSDKGDAAMHEWRKRVKYHLYHARLLGGIAPAMMGPQATALDRLSGLLGDHHDLVVLAARLDAGPDDFGRSTDLDAFRALILERKEALAEMAFDLGRRAFSERRKALVKRWKGYWNAWDRGGSGSGLLIVEP